MANRLYVKGKEKILSADIDWLVDNIKVVLVDGADHTPNTDTHEFLSDVAGPGVVATSGNLANKSVALGAADADPITFLSVTGDQFEYIIVYKDTGVAATSPLIALFDSAVGLPYTPAGNNVTITWDDAVNKIFRL